MLLDSERHQNVCRLLIPVRRSYWEGKDCFRMDIYRAKDLVKLCSIHVSVTDEVVTMFACEYGVHPEVLRSITAQLSDVYTEQEMHCIVRHDD